MRRWLQMAKIATAVTWPATRQDGPVVRLVPPVLCYHRVLPAFTGGGGILDYAVSRQQFADQMTLLHDEGFTSLSLQEYFEAAKGMRELPPRSVVVTFDDGFADNYLEAWPIARRFGVKLNLFICTGLVSRDPVKAFLNPSAWEQLGRKTFPELWQPLSWPQVREMIADGVSVGFHSHSHENLGRLSLADVAADISQGVEVFNANLGQAPRFFAFPFGHYGSYSRAVTSRLGEYGIQMSFSTELGRTSLADSGQIVSRIVIHAEDDLESFRRKVFGGYDWVGRVRKLGYGFREFVTSMPRRWSQAQS